MKLISSVVVLLTGAMVMVGGSFQHSQTADALLFIGGGVGLIGLIAWFREMNKP
jgi:predicted ferric reductase